MSVEEAQGAIVVTAELLRQRIGGLLSLSNPPILPSTGFVFDESFRWANRFSSSLPTLFPFMSLKRLPHLLTLGTLATLSSLLFAADKADKKDAKKEAKEAGHTSNRGPENPELKFKLPPPPIHTAAEELKTFKVPKGFHVELVASEPMVEAPIAMSWDDQGRLYVLEMTGYMNDVSGKGEDQPVCRVKRLEDTDGDGVMDHFTIFVDKLVMPRAVMAIGDGVLIAEPPNVTFYHDTTGSGVADKKDVIATNYGRGGGQPEHMANSLTWCMDNWIWSAAHSERYRYAGGKFIAEATRSGGQWGLTQDDWGRHYFNYNSDFLRADLLPPQMYARNPALTDRTALNYQVMKDQHCWSSVPTPGVNRGYEEGKKKPDGTLSEGQLRADGTLQTCTATCGPVIYRAHLFPGEYYGNAFIPEPSGNLVKRVILNEGGGVVTARNAYDKSEFMTSTDERFRPVNAYNGPDGALYIVDMSRGIIQHKFFLTYYLIANIKDRNLEQPVNLGRIWRVVPDKVKTKPVKLPKESKDIVAFLDHPNGEIRDTAQRLLVERADASVVEAVKKMAVEGKTPQGRVQALWTLEGLNACMTRMKKSAPLRCVSPTLRSRPSC
jgi:glucose/arabinose dehydrogenase